MQVPAFDTSELGDSHTLWCQVTDENDTPDAGSSIAVSVYDDSGHGEMSLSLTPVAVSCATGLNYATVTTSGANGFERGKSYLVRWTAMVSATARVGTGRLHVT